MIRDDARHCRQFRRHWNADRTNERLFMMNQGGGWMGGWGGGGMWVWTVLAVLVVVLLIVVIVKLIDKK